MKNFREKELWFPKKIIKNVTNLLHPSNLIFTFIFLLLFVLFFQEFYENAYEKKKNYYIEIIC